jgi:hypothetical protein
MMKLPIGFGDFKRDISVNLDGKEGTLRILRNNSRDYGEKRNETGAFMYTLFLNSVKVKTDHSIIKLAPKTLLRIAPEAEYSLEPAGHDVPSMMRDNEIPYRPIKTVTFIPPMLKEPRYTSFNPMRVFSPGDRTLDWYCGYYNDGEELGISPIEIAHGYVDNDYFSNPKRNKPHYHRQILEGWIPLYGAVDAVIAPAAEAQEQESENKFVPICRDGETLECLMPDCPAPMHVELSPDHIIATTPGEAHVLNPIEGNGLWETITFKYPGLSREDSEKNKIEYHFGF